MIPVAKTKLGIEFEHVNMLKIKNVWNLSDTFALILPQQRPVLVSAHAQNFSSWSLAKSDLDSPPDLEKKPFFVNSEILGLQI